VQMGDAKQADLISQREVAKREYGRVAEAEKTQEMLTAAQGELAWLLVRRLQRELAELDAANEVCAGGLSARDPCRVTVKTSSRCRPELPRLQKRMQR
jgi:hypothetical protein